MIITVNGEKRKFESPLLVSELLDALNLKSQLVLVERNMEIVPRHEISVTQITDGDTIEILRLVGGG